MRVLQVWKNEKNYRPLFWSGVISGVGSRFTQVASLSMIYILTDSPLAIGLLFVVRMMPFLLLAPFGGMLADLISKRVLLYSVDLLRVPLALLPLCVQTADGLWILYGSAFCIAAGEALYDPTRIAFLPSLVKRDQLLYVNALEQIVTGLVLVVGSSLGGLFVFIFHLKLAFILDSISFLAAAWLIRQLRVSGQRDKQTEQAGKTKEPVYQMVIASGALLIFIFMEATMPLANGVDNVLISIYALDVFHMGEIGVGFMYAGLGLGFILSSLFAKRLKQALIFSIVLGIAMEGVGHLLLGISPSFLVTLCIVVWITFVSGISNICLLTLMMKMVPKSRQGVFFGSMAMISNTALGISMGGAGYLIAWLGARQSSILVGCTYLFLALLYFILFRRIHFHAEKKKLQRQFGSG